MIIKLVWCLLGLVIGGSAGRTAPALRGLPAVLRGGGGDGGGHEQLTLKYWAGRGLMEVPRVMLAIAGKFPGAGYTDERASGTAEMGNSLDSNLGRMPVISCAQGSIGQSVSINFYVASECGLMGSNTFEAAQILSFAEHIRELMEAYRKLVPYGQVPTEEAVNKFFDSNEATDFSGPSDMSKRNDRFLKWYLGRLSSILQNEPDGERLIYHCSSR